MIRAVTFDFWGTLYVDGPHARRRRRLREEYARGFFLGNGYSLGRRQLSYAFEILFHDLERLRQVDQAGVTAEEAGQRLARAMGIKLDPPDACRLGELLSSAGREAPPVPAEGAGDVLSALRGRVRLALISDTGLTLGHDLYAVMEADGIAQLLDHFTFSNQTGTTKPMVRQFHHTLFRLGCRPEEAVHVGDLEETDVAGAHQAGMRAIRIVHPGADAATEADAAVGSIPQVLEVLREWGSTV